MVDPDGDLYIEMQPKNQKQIAVYGELDRMLNAYTSRANSPVVASGPVFFEGGLYNFIVRIVTVTIHELSFLTINNLNLIVGLVLEHQRTPIWM